MNDPRQMDVFEAHARNSDPDTSHAAAAHVQTRISEACQATLEALALYGPCSDEDLQWLYDGNRAWLGWPPQRCIRKRRKDLVDAGLAEFAGFKVKNSIGLPVRAWRVRTP